MDMKKLFWRWFPTVLMAGLAAGNLFMLSQHRRQLTELEQLQTSVRSDIEKLERLSKSLPRTKSAAIPSNSMFHAPSSGCPEGTELHPHAFQLDGKPVEGCWNPEGDGSTDFLRPGESFELVIPMPGLLPKNRGTRI